MKSKRKILIIAPYQFGELSDCYYWAKYATIEGWKITYIGYRYWHRGIKERKFKGVKVKGVYHFSNRILLGINFFITIIWEILIYRHNNIIACRFPYVEKLLKIFPNRNIILDIRTLSVASNPAVRELADNKLKTISQLFKSCSVISEGVRDKLSINANILPLGAECISSTIKDFSELKLFYIGTYNNRKLHVFLEGLADFHNKYGYLASFDIVGGGDTEEENKIKQTISEYNLCNVTLHGFMTHDDAQRLFDKCNVGVCFVPITEYYEHQPPTKLYEYLLSGMACIATKTKSNMDVMRENIGVMIDDNRQSVCEGLFQLYQNKEKYSSKEIVSMSMQYHWMSIVKNSFIKLFQK